MKYKIGSSIPCNVKTYTDGKRKVINSKPEKDDVITKEKFEVIWIDERDRNYVIAVPPDMIGWGLSEWHVMYWDINKKFLKMKHFWVPIEENNDS